MGKTLIWIVAFAVAVACGLFSAKLAGDKGRSPLGYGLLGFVLPIIGIIVAAAVPRKA